MRELLQKLLNEQKIDDAVYKELLGAYEKVENDLKVLEKSAKSFEIELKTLEKQIETTSDEKLKEELENTRKELIKLKKENMLKSELDRYEFAVSPSVVFDALIHKIDDDFKLNGKDLGDGVKEYLDEHLDLLKAIGKTGSGIGQTGTAKILGGRAW